jgi:NCS1 family nucleobase:cation symporter-1
MKHPEASPEQRLVAVETQLGLEKRGIDYIPPDERHGRPNTLLTFWGASTVTVVAAVTGALTIAFGLDLQWAILTIVIGNVFGGLFMAYHSVQGPRLGMPQMIQSRAQFGFYGALLPLLVVLVLYIGYFVLGIVVGGQALSALTHMPVQVAMIISAAIMLGMTWFGYDLFHRYNRIISVLSVLLFVALTIRLLTLLPAAHLVSSPAAYGTILLSISVFASWQITYAPYVSDYSRYLPVSTPSTRTFWYTYVGSVGGSIWAMSLGAIAAAIASHAFGYFASLFPLGAEWLVLLILVLGVYASNYENPYGAFLTVLTAISPTGTRASGATLRIIFTTVITVVSTVIAFLATANFLTNLENFLVYVLVVLIPWTAINLTDFYLVRRGHYAISEFFKIDGIYGGINWLTIGVFLFTILIEIPFLDTAYYEGPLAHRLGGGDISWIVGAIVASLLYYFLATRVGHYHGESDPPIAAQGRPA